MTTSEQSSSSSRVVERSSAPSYFVIDAPLGTGRQFWRGPSGMVAGKWGSLADATPFIAARDAAYELQFLLRTYSTLRDLRVVRVSTTTLLEEVVAPKVPTDRWVVVSAEGEFLRHDGTTGWSPFFASPRAWSEKYHAKDALSKMTLEDRNDEKFARARVMRVSFSEAD